MANTIPVEWQSQEGRYDLFALDASGANVLVCASVTIEGCEWLAGEMSLVDDGDTDMLKTVAVQTRKRMPVRYSWMWQNMQARKLDNAPIRRANGTFRTQGIA